MATITSQSMGGSIDQSGAAAHPPRFLSGGMGAVAADTTNVTMDGLGSRAGKDVKNQWDFYSAADRSSWWKCQIKPTPLPGCYASPATFLEVLANQNNGGNAMGMTYGFHNSGRRRRCGLECNHKLEDFAMPGAYRHHAFEDWIKEKPSSISSFKAPLRKAMTLGCVDKELSHLSPAQYHVKDDKGIAAPILPASHSFFKSRVKRLPSKEFDPKVIGPDPTKYHPIKMPLINQPIKSCFLSNTPRFTRSHTKIPGPGSYDPYESFLAASLS